MRYRIRELRTKRGLSQDELSKISGVSRATIWKLETGESDITTTKTLGKIAVALHVPVMELFFDGKV